MTERPKDNVNDSGTELQGSAVQPTAMRVGLCGPHASMTQHRPLKIACLNVASLSTKAQALERMMAALSIDLLFLSETWCEEGQAERYSQWVVHANAHPRKSIHGHAPYGQAIMLNPATTRKDEFRLLKTDQTTDKSFSVVQFCGVTFVCAYFAPNRTTDWFLEKLDAATMDCLTDTPVVLMGDLNARHASFGDHSSNTYGNILVEEIPTLGLQRLEPRSGRWTFMSHNGRSIVDHVLVNEAAAKTTRNLCVHEGRHVGDTEHKLLVFETDGISIVETTIQAPRPWNRLRLKDPSVREELVSRCTEGIDQLLDQLTEMTRATDMDPRDTACAAEAAIRRWIETGLEAVVGRAPPPKAGWAERFMTRELLASETVVEHHYQKWFRRKDEVGSLRRWETYMAHERAHKKLAAKRKREMFMEFCDKFVSMEKVEQIRTVSAMARNKSRTRGSSLKTDSASLGLYGQHFASQFMNLNPPTYGPERQPTPPTAGFDASSALSREAIAAHIGMLASGKASGNSGLPAEALKALSDLVVEPLHVLLKFCFEQAVVPDNWTRARIHPVPKKGDLTLIANYRPISLTEVMRKLYESLLLPHLKGWSSRWRQSKEASDPREVPWTRLLRFKSGLASQRLPEWSDTWHFWTLRLPMTKWIEASCGPSARMPVSQITCSRCSRPSLITMWQLLPSMACSHPPSRLQAEFFRAVSSAHSSTQCLSTTSLNMSMTRVSGTGSLLVEGSIDCYCMPTTLCSLAIPSLLSCRC